MNGADQALGASPHAHVADPGSAALVTYLGAIGLVASSETVAQWLAFVRVVALELGSALAGLLVQAVSYPKIPAPKAADTTKKSKVADAIVDHLKANGGAVRGSHRVLRSQARCQQKHDKSGAAQLSCFGGSCFKLFQGR